MVSELGLNNIWPLFWQKKHKKSFKSQLWSILTVVGQNMGQILSKLNSETIFGIFIKASLLDTNVKLGSKIYFRACHITLKKSLVREPKKLLLRGKNYSMLLPTSNSTGFTPKAWKKVNFLANWRALSCMRDSGRKSTIMQPARKRNTRSFVLLSNTVVFFQPSKTIGK